MLKLFVFCSSQCIGFWQRHCLESLHLQADTNPLRLTVTMLRQYSTIGVTSTACCAEPRSTPSRTPSLLSGSRPQLLKSDNKGKNRPSSEAAAELSWNQVPLEALVRKSSPIAMNPKQQQEQEQPPAEPQVCPFGTSLHGQHAPMNKPCRLQCKRRVPCQIKLVNYSPTFCF